jgi:hypothetical protein
MSKDKIIKIAIAIFSAIAIYYIIQTYRKRLTIKTMSGQTKKYVFKRASTAGEIEKLHPSFREQISDYITELESPENGNLTVTITSGIRNRPTDRKTSLHYFGFAADINIDGTDAKGNKIALRLKTPVGLTADQNKELWRPYAEKGFKHGLRWGGNFGDYKNKMGFWDVVHFDNQKNGSLGSVWLSRLEAGRVDKNGFVIV